VGRSETSRSPNSGGAVEPLSENQQVRELIRRCLVGDHEAAREFQLRYGELIYGYPRRAYGLPAEDAGDFYVFAFDGARIFRRLRTFRGEAPFQAYLVGSVLDHLVLEWQRGTRAPDLVPMEGIEDLGEPADLGGTAGGDEDLGMDNTQLNELLARLDRSDAVVMKLLHIEDCELSPSELRHLAEQSCRSLPEALAGIEQLRASVRGREEKAKRLADTLDEVQAWIELYERRLQRITADLRSLPPNASAARLLEEERADIERKAERRRRQRGKVLNRRRRRKVTAPYKEIADLLNTTVGNVGSQITRARQKLTELARRGDREARTEAR